MLEKTGAVTLTEEELIEAKRGEIPSRIKDTWNLSLEELQSIITSGNYRVAGNGTPPNVH